MNLYTQSEKNIRKTWLLMTAFLLFTIFIGWVFSRAMDTPVILFIAIIFSFGMSFLSYWKSDKIVLAMSGAKKVEFQDNPELYRIVENLCITAGLPIPKIFVIEDLAPNAFATGRDPQHSVIVFTRGLLNALDRSEIEGVAAHELSHIGNRDILLGTVVVVLVGFIAFASDFFLRSNFWRGKSKSDNDSGGLMFGIAIILAILAPISATLIQLAISRKREFLADANGALLTRYPEGLASALKKISQSAIPLKTASKATAHLYIANPLKKGAIGKLFMTHPPMEERIEALLGMEHEEQSK
ncbi:MAG: M48 family metallopeptidase [bacterium]